MLSIEQDMQWAVQLLVVTVIGFVGYLMRDAHLTLRNRIDLLEATVKSLEKEIAGARSECDERINEVRLDVVEKISVIKEILAGLKG